MRGLVLLVLCGVLFAAPGVLAQDSGLAPLNGVGRVTVAGGVRLSGNDTFFDSFYPLPGHACTPTEGNGCSRASPPGPLFAATFAYSLAEDLELGIDLFATQQVLRPTGSPALINITYGALVGLRFQGVLDILTPQGVVPFIGLETGPSLALSTLDGVARRELVVQPWVGDVGMTLRLSPHWGVTAEYRLAFVRGQTPYNALGEGLPDASLSFYNAGGSWFSLGVTYMLSPDPVRQVSMP